MSGQDVVEFALVAPLFFFLTFAIVDYGRMFFIQLNLQQAVQEAGRFASTGNKLPNGSGGNLSRINSIISYATTAAFGATSMGASVANITVNSVNSAGQTSNNNGGGPLDVVTITLTTTVPFITPFVANIFPGGQYTIVASTTIKNEPFPPGQNP
ncbi:MAG TPA: TadE/TadG family type IV pilus assembly protein [Candidatus Binataceae bacterium]|nr:TadE/TadG family type IV pilus assembly protein [Candidatus Binataceae bacterium]